VLEFDSVNGAGDRDRTGDFQNDFNHLDRLCASWHTPQVSHKIKPKNPENNAIGFFPD